MLALCLPTLEAELPDAERAMAMAQERAGVKTLPIIEVDREGVGWVRPANRALSRALLTDAPYIGLLAADLRHFPANWAHRLIDVLTLDAYHGVAVPGLRCGTAPQRYGKPGMRPGWRVADMVCYTVAVFKRELWEQVGLLDETYIHYGADYEHVRQAQARQWRAVWVQDVFVVHDWQPLEYPDWKDHDAPIYYGRHP